MDAGFLVATQLSSLYPSQATSVPLQTSRQGVPLPPPPSESDPPAEHATYSSVLHTPVTGTILLRVLHGGLIIELVSLSTEVSPIRFVFPGRVLPFPAIFLWEASELHVLAVVDTGSLYRLVVPIASGRELWRNQAPNIWPREYLLKNMEDAREGLVHVQGTHSVIIGLRNGSLLRLENDYVGEGTDDEWTETVYQYTSFLSSLTSFLPLTGGPSTGSEPVSIATHPWPTDIGHVWTLSRDRTLRFWKAKIGCVASKAVSPGKEASPSPGSSTSGGKPHIMLDVTPQTLLRVFTSPTQEDHIYVIVFIPTISSPSSGGTFHLFDTFSDQLYEVGKIEASANTAHCHLQDFMIAGNALFALWDAQGQSMVAKTVINVQHLNEGFHPAPWYTSCYAPEPELTPAYLEEILLSPGSMTEKFFEAIMRPGMFSALTLRTALDQYIDACLSMLGPRPPQLGTTYATISEHIAAVVGCTVNLNRDTQTGAYQYATYWSALKRDWEGFIARCREVERSARRPLALGAQDQGEIIHVERERVGLLVSEDLPIYLTRLLAVENPPLEPQYELLSILWTLKSRLGPHVMLQLENRMMDIIHQEVAFSLPDILQDQTRRFRFREEMDEGSLHWIIGRLQSIEDLDSAARKALDIIGGFDVEVKREEDEVELLLPPPHSEWARALTAAYISKTVDARYELALALVTLLFFLSDEISEWDPSLLAEIFAVFRGVAILRFTARHPASAASDTPPATSDLLSADDVVHRMRNMNVSRSSKTLLSPTYSIVHRLLAESGDTHGLPGAAHRFLDSIGLLQSVSPANATKYEVLFCEKLRLLGFYDASRELLSWLPRTAGASYVLARLWLNLGKPDDASYLLEKLAGSFAGNFGGDHVLSAEDQEALARILPATELLDSQYNFYIHASNLFKVTSWVHHEVSFAQLAISVAPPDADTSSLWATVINGLTELGYYDDAYASLMSSPYEKLKRELVSQLTYRMCDDNAVETLMTFNFAGIADEVQDALAFKARNVDIRVHPSYSKILHTWFIRRGDYRNAALAMYQRARKLQDLIHDPTSFASLAEEQLEAYLVAINALSLVEPKNAWVLLPMPADHFYEPHKRRKLPRYIPERRFTPGKFDSDIIRLADMEYDYALLAAQIDMVRRDPALLASPEFLLPPSVIVLRLAQANRFSQAMATARSLNVDMTDLFSHLTGQCLRLSRNADTVIQEDTSDWLLTDKVSSWPGTPADRGWRYLRHSLQEHDSAETDYKYTKATLETILGSNSSPPPWLIHILEENHHEFLIRISLRYENFEDAIEHTLSLIRKSDSQLAREAPQNACATWLPYTLIDQVLKAAAEATSTPRLSALRSEIATRVKRMHKLSQFPA
ncbi:putative nucleoporin Nup120/160 [Lyophyllum shimeji]|uniref:Nucleoporin Nup120/160 n=1 Tax=Lyophyllum shimeji TaxID=47721 RepID=A0A9P3PCE5_LYOSH|nr:putative nucleoporin Nup120/160 [Lyophyllum shimeji]